MLLISLPNMEVVEIRQDLWHCKKHSKESNNQQLLQLKRKDLSAKNTSFPSILCSARKFLNCSIVDISENSVSDILLSIM